MPLFRSQIMAPGGGGSATLPPPVRLSKPLPTATVPAPDERLREEARLPNRVESRSSKLGDRLREEARLPNRTESRSSKTKEPSAHDRARALVGEGLDAARARDFQEASRLLTKALELDPSDAEAWNSLGVVLIRQGEATQGVGALRRALRVDPGHAEAHRNLAVALDGQGRCREAALHYRSFMSRSDTANPYREDVTRRLAELQPNGRSCE